MYEENGSDIFIDFDTLLINVKPLRLLKHEIHIEQFLMVNSWAQILQNDTLYNFTDLIEFYASDGNTVIEDDTRGSGRAIEGYNIYTGPLSDVMNAASWTPINSTPIADTFHVDTQWPPAVEDSYVWAIEAIYTTGNSVFSFSNPIVGSPPVSVPEEFDADAVNVYPNPATNMLYISNCEEGTAVIYSITGQEIEQYRLSGQLNDINVSNFENGLYIIKIVGNNNEVTIKKFLKN